MARGEERPVRRVLLVLQSVAVGGMEGQCEGLAGEFVRRGIQVTVVVPPSTEFNGLSDRLCAVGASVERLDTDARRGRAPQAAALLRLLGFMRHWRPDAV